MASYACYIPRLTTSSQRKAREELNENPNENKAQLKQFALWIEQHRKWLTCPTDPVFLMAFLRVRKFSQLLARESLVNFFLTRKREAAIFQNIHLNDTKIQAVLKTGFTLPLPRSDNQGRQVFICRPGLLNTSGKEYDVLDMFRAAFLLFDQYLRNEDAQVNGFVLVVDLTGVTRQFGTFLGEHRGKFLKIISKAYPVRLKSLLLYNAGPLLELALIILKSVLREKMQKRIEIAHTMTDVYEKLGQSALPCEYLPDDFEGDNSGTSKEIIDAMLSSLQIPEAREWTQLISNRNHRVEESDMPPRDELFTEAFRKLEVH